MVCLAHPHFIEKGATLTMHGGTVVSHRVLMIYLKCDCSLTICNAAVLIQAEEGQYNLGLIATQKLCQHKNTLWHHSGFLGPRPNFFIYWYIYSWMKKKKKKGWTRIDLNSSSSRPAVMWDRSASQSLPRGLMVGLGPCWVCSSYGLCEANKTAAARLGLQGWLLMEVRRFRNGLDAFISELSGQSPVIFPGLGYWLNLKFQTCHQFPPLQFHCSVPDII